MKHTNVFMFSDASFKDGKSTIAIKDGYTGETYQKHLSFKVSSSLRAEEIALRESIDIAIKKEYKHVIFVYDCLAIKIDKFKRRHVGHFETMQFLWVRRKFIDEIDKLTKTEENKDLLEISSMTDFERDIRLIKELSKYAKTDDEIAVFQSFGESKNNKIEIKNRSILLNYFYFLLSRVGKTSAKNTLKENIVNTDLKKVFALKHKREYTAIVNLLGIKNEFLVNLTKYKVQKC